MNCSRCEREGLLKELSISWKDTPDDKTVLWYRPLCQWCWEGIIIRFKNVAPIPTLDEQYSSGLFSGKRGILD